MSHFYGRAQVLAYRVHYDRHRCCRAEGVLVYLLAEPRFLRRIKAVPETDILVALAAYLYLDYAVAVKAYIYVLTELKSHRRENPRLVKFQTSEREGFVRGNLFSVVCQPDSVVGRVGAVGEATVSLEGFGEEPCADFQGIADVRLRYVLTAAGELGQAEEREEREKRD